MIARVQGCACQPFASQPAFLSAFSPACLSLIPDGQVVDKDDVSVAVGGHEKKGQGEPSHRFSTEAQSHTILHITFRSASGETAGKPFLQLTRHDNDHQPSLGSGSRQAERREELRST